MPLRSQANPTPTQPRASERALSLVEMLVVMTIVAILMATVINAFSGSKAASYKKEAESAGAAYAQAIAQYQSDHGRRNPTAARPGGVAAGNNGAAQQRGPRNLVGEHYLRSVPEGVSAGRIGVTFATDGAAYCNDTKSAPATTQAAWVSVCFGSDPSYAVRVIARKNGGTPWTDANTKICWLGDTTRTPRC